MKIKLLTSVLLTLMSAQMQGQEEAPKLAKDDSYAELLMKRYSGRLYDPKRPVTQEQLQLIINAGQMAPSSSNEQPWRFIICDKATDAPSYDKVFNTLVKFNQDWAKNAPVLIVAIAAKKWSKDGKPNRWAVYDTGAAAFSMMMQATAIGLMAH